MDKIVIRGARQHNLKNIDVDLPRNQFTVVTGLSGSGKSSLAFDTLYAEGQRRYVESLSSYARQFLEKMDRPDVDLIEGLSPAIAVEQQTVGKNPRSTVGTITEIHDYLRVLFARLGQPHCLGCGREIKATTVQQMVDRILELPEGTRILMLSPLVENRRGHQKRLFTKLRREGFVRVRVDGSVLDLDQPIQLEKDAFHRIEVVVDRIIVRPDAGRRVTDSMELALRTAQGRARIAALEGEEWEFCEQPLCHTCNLSFPELSPQLFSFNSALGACPVCSGLGSLQTFDPGLIVPNPALSLRNGAIAPWTNRRSMSFLNRLEVLGQRYHFDLDTRFRDLPQEARHVLLYGSGEQRLPTGRPLKDRQHLTEQPFEGVIPYLERRRGQQTDNVEREEISAYLSNTFCTSCKGARLRPESLAVTVKERNINQVSKLDLASFRKWIDDLEFSRQQELVAQRLLRQVTQRLHFLGEVGLSYLSLDRAATTLSGGEAQRLRLATLIGSRLTGVLYILDEPSIGLHQRDNQRLLDSLKALRDLGNTVLVVEHDAETIMTSDHVIDVGPGAGANGGHLVFSGQPESLLHHSDSLTGHYLSGRLSIPVPGLRRSPDRGYLTIEGAAANNLHNITASLPIGLFTCVTGVSGSGKSTLVLDTLYRAAAKQLHRSREAVGTHGQIRGLEKFAKVVHIDQSAIGRTPRSNPATYTGIFTQIRNLLAQVPEARARGYHPGRFSFNVKGGRCEACNGQGTLKIEMHFLPDVYVTCDVCKGLRFNRDTLEIIYKGKNIAEMLDLTINEAYRFFANIPAIKDKLATMQAVGMGYLALGQAATTLSGGEAQRIKLARELSKRSDGRTLYLLDEPTTGLHFDDIQKLLYVLNRLVEAGNTVVVIEHHLDVIKTSDYIIDLGPEGGTEGGRIVGTGTPEEIAQIPESYTGQYLRKVLER
ncbi:MAG: excinuclease ABC subunit UvrA [Deltaproteobacteria bacterium]|nr:MAG: excinuclease ABC subunit UvrA [Deltaproteobacteria bacterium]